MDLIFSSFQPSGQFKQFFSQNEYKPTFVQAGRALLAFLKPLIEMLHVERENLGDYNKFVLLINAHMHTKTKVEVEKAGYFHVDLSGRDRCAR